MAHRSRPRRSADRDREGPEIDDEVGDNEDGERREADLVSREIEVRRQPGGHDHIGNKENERCEGDAEGQVVHRESWS